MHHQEFESPEELREVIKCFWYNRREADEREPSFEVQPDGYAEIIFHFGNLFSISQNGNLQPLPSPFMMGLLGKPAVFYTENRLEIIGVRCFPWTVYDLLNLPSGKGGINIIKHPIAGLQLELSNLLKTGKIDEALAKVKQYFQDTHREVTNDRILFKAGTAMRKANGTLPVSEVAAVAHATVRTLERKFKQSSGHTVKDVSGLIRFEQVRNELWLHPDTNLAGLSQKLGYADQAHLSREFKRYSGHYTSRFCTPHKEQKAGTRWRFCRICTSLTYGRFRNLCFQYMI